MSKRVTKVTAQALAGLNAGAPRQDSETCHCGAGMHGADHCPVCGCEAFESFCDLDYRATLRMELVTFDSPADAVAALRKAAGRRA
jgi:hypothetical protein